MTAIRNKHKIIVGLFILLGLLIFFAGILALGGQKKTFVKTITLNAVFNDVSGLQAGNNVWFSGVKVGTIDKVKLAGNARVEVELEVEQRVRDFIRKDARVKLGTEGFIGNRIILITGGTAQAPAVETGDVLAVEKAQSMDDMMAVFQENNNNLQAITRDFKAISNRLAEGRGTIGKLLSDESLMIQFQKTLATMQRASGNAEVMTANLAGYTSRLQAKGVLSNDLVTDTILFGTLRATVARLQELTKTANDITGNLKTATDNLNNQNNAVSVLFNDKQAASDLKTTLKNLQSGTQKLDENMEALQHNILFRGYFKKKQKDKPAEGQ